MKAAAEILGIEEQLQRKPRQLSGGQPQRVALGRAIVRHPQVFLFDEPLSNLDAKLLRSYVGENVTLGIRPEDLHVASDSDAAGLSFDAVVEVIGKLGSQILSDVRVGPNTMVAAVEPTIKAKVRDRLRLALNPDRLYFFDRVSQAAI